MKVTTLSVPFPGTKRVLEEGAKLKLWDFVLLSGGNVHIPGAETYIFGAWHPAYSQLLNLGSRVGVLWTSSAGEMDFTPIEQDYLNAVLSDPRIAFVWFGDPALAEAYPAKSFYAPYPLCVDGLSPPDVEKKDIVTLFCPTKPSKNILNQLYAVKLVQRKRKLVLHTNVEGYDNVLRELDCVRHRWLPEQEYRALLLSARVNLACSWAETFDYGVAEAGLCGTPSVISRTVPLPGVVVYDPNDPLEIADAVLRAEHEIVFSKTVAKAEQNNALLKSALAAIMQPR